MRTRGRGRAPMSVKPYSAAYRNNGRECAAKFTGSHYGLLCAQARLEEVVILDEREWRGRASWPDGNCRHGTVCAEDAIAIRCSTEYLRFSRNSVRSTSLL